MVAITRYLDHREGAEGKPRVDPWWEKVDSLVQVEQSGKTLPLCHPWAHGGHQEWITALSFPRIPPASPQLRAGAGHFQLSIRALEETYLPPGAQQWVQCVLSWRGGWSSN